MFIGKNLELVTLGNIVGAVLFVAVPYHLASCVTYCD